VIASWPKPNYIDPVTQGPALIYLCIVFSCLILASVAARTYSRIFLTKAPGIDDLLIAIAAGFSIALSVLIIIQQTTWLTGHHIWDIPLDKFVGQRINIYACEWCYLMATCCVKISILLFYRRLSGTFSTTFLVATWAGIIFNVLYGLAFFILLASLFQPLDSYWLSFDPTWAATHKYIRGNERWTLPVSAGLSVVGDFYSTALPLMLIHFLHLPHRQKAALYTLFGLGFFVVAAGIVRTVKLNRVVRETYDSSWALWENWIWTVVELNVAILAASAPALKPFVRRFLVDPIISSGRQTPYAYDSRRRSSLGQARAAGRFRWSNGTMTAPDSNMLLDTEKIGIALTAPQSKGEMIEDEIDDGVSTRRYQLRSSRDGKLVPVQVHEQGSFDARSLHEARSSDTILAPGKMGDFDASPKQKQYQITDLSLSQSRPQSSPRTQNQGADYLRGSLDRIPSQSSAESKSDFGSVAVAQARARAHQRHLEEFSSQESAFPNTHTQTRSISRGSERNFSLPSTTAVGGSPYQNMFPERIEDDRNSSEDTPGLPRTGSSNGTRPVSVGFAV
jgi:hypothetical protein